jgi:mannitol/fructose-specific phosphotransferase system IIA component (Ntr-type)
MLNRFISNERIYINPKVKNRDELFQLIAEDAAKHELVEDQNVLCTKLIQREEQGSTELEPGIAIPHAKFPEAKKVFVYVIISKKGIPFGGVLSRGAKIIFLLAAPPEDDVYVALLAHVARLLKKEGFKDGLMAAEVKGDVLTIIRKHEEIEEAAVPGKKGMHGIFLIMNKREGFETAMSLMVELGVKNAIILDSTNIKAKLAFDIPFLGLLSERMKKTDSKVLVGMVDSSDTVAKLYRLLKAEGFDIARKGTGALFSIPLGILYGAYDEDFDF